MIAYIKSDSIEVELHRNTSLTYFLVVKRADRTLTIGRDVALTLEEAYVNIKDYSNKNGKPKLMLVA
jgi:hypothetical protein